MPLRRVSPGTIPYGYEPPMLRKKREIEADLQQEYNDYLDKRLRSRPERFSRPLDGQTPFTNSNELPVSTEDKRDIKYRVIPQGGQLPAGERNGPPKGVVIHWTGSQNDTIEGLIANSHDPKHPGRGYDYVVDREGNVHAMNTPGTYSNHIMGPGHPFRTNKDFPDLSSRNTVSIGILGDGSDISKTQRTAAEQFLGEIVPAYKIDPNKVVGHGELQGGKGGNKEFDEGRDFATNFRSSPAASSSYDPFGTDTAADRLTSPPATGTDVAASPDYSASSVSRVPSQISSSGTIPTFGEIFGITTPIGDHAGKGPGEFKNPVQVPTVDQLGSSGNSILQAAGPEGEFPAPPPPPPRTPPGMQPPLQNKRRRGYFA